jgi:hypothetical protein
MGEDKKEEKKKNEENKQECWEVEEWIKGRK